MRHTLMIPAALATTLVAGAIVGTMTAAAKTRAASDAAAAKLQAKPSSRAVADAANAANAFGAKALGELVGPAGEQTVVLSPYGIATTLNMLTFGARGVTHTTLRQALGPLRPEIGKPEGAKSEAGKSGGGADWRVRIAYKSIHRSLATASTPAVTVSTVNGLWLSDRYSLQAPYRRLLDDTFRATVERADFTKPTALGQINGWAGKATRGMIPEVVSQLDPATELVLANAVYFKGAWATAFSPEATKDAPFTRVNGATRTVPMMAARLNLDYAEAPGYHAIRLPYAGDRLTMTVVAATDAAQAGKVWRDSWQPDIDTMLRSLNFSFQPVDVRLPRFKSGFAAELNPTLERLGLGPALGSGANFTALTPAPLKALTIVHKTMLEVSETGTEAAAVTAAIATRSLEPQPTVFDADRPFLLAITDQATGVQLFLGYIAEP
jgi:serine protease inhibitor